MKGIEPSAIVLVHGAWFGGWCWSAVADEFRESGYPVYTPTLTGLADRQDEYRASIDLETHVGDIVTLIEREDLHDLHLVGWSYAGMVITGVLNRVPGRIARLTYLDAYLPGHGRSAASYLPMTDRVLLSLAGMMGKGVPLPDPRRWGIADEALIGTLQERLTMHPPRTLTRAVAAPVPLPAHVSYRYIWCSGYQGSVFERFHQQAMSDPLFTVRNLPLGHAAVLTDAPAVCQAILD